ncbi:MAG: hypothetical protein JW800_04765 [Candidatus Omnitrophica bacterium]|nr:hypothetical protein [Candidatus Omnitrophota bacterium]
MKNKWMYLAGCFIAPHLMLITGVFFISKKDLEYKLFGLRLCKWSTAVLIVGTLLYYVAFTPITGLD